MSKIGVAVILPNLFLPNSWGGFQGLNGVMAHLWIEAGKQCAPESDDQ